MSSDLPVATTAGLEGLELFYDDHLRGVPGRKWVIRDARRRMIEDVENIESPKEGEDLQLSLDRRLQFVAYRALKSAVAKHRAEGRLGGPAGCAHAARCWPW